MSESSSSTMKGPVWSVYRTFFGVTFFYEKRVQEWSPCLKVMTAERGITFGARSFPSGLRYRISFSKRTKHFKDNAWRAE